MISKLDTNIKSEIMSKYTDLIKKFLETTREVSKKCRKINDTDYDKKYIQMYLDDENKRPSWTESDTDDEDAEMYMNYEEDENEEEDNFNNSLRCLLSINLIY